MAVPEASWRERSSLMPRNIIYIIGLVVIVVIVLGFLGLR